MMRGSEVVQFAGCFDYFLNTGITKFYHITCFDINEVIVLNALVRFLKLGNIFSKLMFHNQVTIQ